MEMLLTGEPIDARTACAWRLVNQVVPVGELDTTVRHWTDIILSRSPAAIRVGKETFYRQIDGSLQAAYDVASETMSRNALLEDAAEGMDAFLQKRPPTWRGPNLTSGNAQPPPAAASLAAGVSFQLSALSRQGRA